jgi:hypothetical protein
MVQLALMMLLAATMRKHNGQSRHKFQFSGSITPDRGYSLPKDQSAELARHFRLAPCPPATDGDSPGTPRLPAKAARRKSWHGFSRFGLADQEGLS